MSHRKNQETICRDIEGTKTGNAITWQKPRREKFRVMEQSLTFSSYLQTGNESSCNKSDRVSSTSALSYRWNSLHMVSGHSVGTVVTLTLSYSWNS